MLIVTMILFFVLTQEQNAALFAAVMSLIAAVTAALNFYSNRKTSAKIDDVHTVQAVDVSVLKKSNADALQELAEMKGTADAQGKADRARLSANTHAAAVQTLLDSRR